MLYFLRSVRPITMYGRTGEHRVWPRWLIEEESVERHPLRSKAETYESFWDFCVKQRPKTIFFLRTHSLGDILMLVAVVRAFRRHWIACIDAEAPTITIGGYPRYIDTLIRLKGVSGIEGIYFRRAGSISDYGCEVHYDLSHFLERDHRGEWQSDLHRCELYAQSLGFTLRKDSVMNDTVSP